MSRKIIPFIVAFVLACLVMVVSGVFAFSGAVTAQKFGSDVAWVQPYYTAESMKVIDLNGDGQDELFIQNTSDISTYDASGNRVWNFSYGTPKTTLGDVNGDNVEDIIVFYAGLGMSVDTIINGQQSTLADNLPIGTPARNVLIRFSSAPQIVLGDSSGSLLSLKMDGNTAWQNTFSSEEIRGLDDAKISGETYLAAASHDGTVSVLNENGGIVWQVNQEQLRRMRAFDLNADGNSEIITGGEYGAFFIYSAVDGSVLFNKSLGQAVSEVREVELNGDPSSREIIVGGKDGGVWAFSFNGTTATQLWTASLSDKVTEIAGIDINEDGKEEAVLGDELGNVAIFTETGSRNNLPKHSSGITRIDIGKLGNERYVVVADGSEIQVNKVNFNSIPGFQYTPLIVGLIVSAIILIIAAILASIPPKPELKLSLQDNSRESLEAQRRMLKESIADVERLRKSGEVTGDAYLTRLKRLRGDLAENETAYKTAGYPIKVETFQCPKCGGTLELGMDKCEYCGQAILT
ncbi:MAG: WD40 repeat domain-containing protein [Anaerolineales bacterium]|uniref:outer membrane protein assembly factor BamB family protein n=1 Tax=Candidatus Villigracilis proximus TaxID=3140683 RepID=UPI003135C078|nr:WD40 repeat domain-containing protein [Anaerolineales bacterium]